MTSSCAATAAASTATKHALAVQAANQHQSKVAADTIAAAKHGNTVAIGASAAGGSSAGVLVAMLSLQQGGT